MSDFFPIYIYFFLAAFVTLNILGASAISPKGEKNPIKYMPYESGIRTTTHLYQKRFPIRHYLVALIFLVFDIEAIFLFPWAVIAKDIGPFAFYEMALFLAALLIGLVYVWRKGGLEWE